MTEKSNMKIMLNGGVYFLEGVTTVEALADKLNLNTSQVAIEKNRQIVPRATYGEAHLAEGDEIEIVRFIGGG